MRVDPKTGLRSFDSRREYNEFIEACAAPTADDVPVLADGTQIDSREKALADLAELRALSEAAQARQSDAAAMS